jgi:hypothetical protein
MKKTELQQAIAQLLFENQWGMTNAAISTVIEVPVGSVFAALKIMCEQETIVKIEKTYIISDIGIATFALKHADKSHLAQSEEPTPDNPNMRNAIHDFQVHSVDVSDVKQVVEIIAKSCGIKAKPVDTLKKSVLPDEFKAQVIKAFTNPMEGFETRIPTYDINDDPIVASDILPDLRYKPIPVNVKADTEIKTHINNTVTDAGEHYRLEYRGVKIDPFRIAQVYGIKDFAMMTVLKKVLRAGRAHKDLRQDLLDMKCAIDRKLEMMAEDNAFE